MFSPYTFGYLLALFGFAFGLIVVLALVRWMYSGDVDYAKATFRKPWVWALSLIVFALLAFFGSP